MRTRFSKWKHLHDRLGSKERYPLSRWSERDSFPDLLPLTFFFIFQFKIPQLNLLVPSTDRKSFLEEILSYRFRFRFYLVFYSHDLVSDTLSKLPSETFFLMSMDYLRILRSKSCPMDTFVVKSCGTLAPSSTWDSWPHDLSFMLHALDSHSSACNLRTCSWEHTLFEHFLWMDCCRRRYCQSATSSHQGGMMHRFERSVWLVINKVAIWTAERENEASFVRGRRYPFCSCR